MVAAQRGRKDAVNILLAIGANRFAMDGEGRMAADFAEDGGFVELAERLAGEPREGDFELSEPAELGGEMVAQVMAETGEAGVMEASPGPEAGEPELAGGEPTDPEIAATEAGDSEDPEAADPAGDAETGEGDPVAVNDSGESPSGDDPPTGEGEGGTVGLPAEAEAPGSGVATLEGAVVGVHEPADASSALIGEAPQAPIVMRSYRETELPLRVESTREGVAQLKVAGGESVEVPEGDTIPGSNLKVIRIERRMASGKDDADNPTEISVVTVEDALSGVDRELIVGLPALAHDPIALVEDAAGGTYYVARTGQRFRSADGRDFIVGDVRPNQVVIEEVATGETTTLRLRGPRG